MNRGKGILIAGLALAALAVLLYAFDPVQTAWYPKCLFHQLTGLSCPGCGTARALHALVHLRVADAFWYNPALLPSLLYVGWLAADAKRAARPRIVWTYLVLLLVWWVARNLFSL